MSHSDGRLKRSKSQTETQSPASGGNINFEECEMVIKSVLKRSSSNAAEDDKNKTGKECIVTYKKPRLTPKQNEMLFAGFGTKNVPFTCYGKEVKKSVKSSKDCSTTAESDDIKIGKECDDENDINGTFEKADFTFRSSNQNTFFSKPIGKSKRRRESEVFDVNISIMRMLMKKCASSDNPYPMRDDMIRIAIAQQYDEVTQKMVEHANMMQSSFVQRTRSLNGRSPNETVDTLVYSEGPKGGRYRINSNGNKQYIKPSTM